MKPCIKWPSTSTALFVHSFRVWDNTTKNVSLKMFISWKQFRKWRRNKKEFIQFTLCQCMSVFFSVYFDAFILNFVWYFGILLFSLSLSLASSVDPHSSYILFRSLCTFIITSDTNRYFISLGLFQFVWFSLFHFSVSLWLRVRQFFVFNAHFSVIRFGPPSKVKCCCVFFLVFRGVYIYFSLLLLIRCIS